MRNNIRLLKNLAVLAVLVFGVIFVFKKCSSDDAEGKLALEDSPLHIENIAKIAELAMVSFQDELVLDTIEYYNSSTDYVTGNVWKLHDLDNIKHVFSESDVKRRLTLIAKVEAKIGFRLTDKNYRVEQNKDTIWFHFPLPEILDFNSNPSETEVFKENGNWDDQARKNLMKRAERKTRYQVQQMDLDEKAKEGLKSLLKNILKDERTKMVYFQ